MIPQIARIQGKAKGQTEGQTGGEKKGREEIGKVKRKGMRENKETGQKGSREVRVQGHQLKKFIWKQEGKRENEAVGREGGKRHQSVVYLLPTISACLLWHNFLQDKLRKGWFNEHLQSAFPLCPCAWHVEALR